MDKKHLTIEIETLPKNTDTPLLNHCRTLLREGYSGDTEITYTRGGCVAFLVASIADGAKLSVKNEKFIKYQERSIYGKKTRN